MDAFLFTFSSGWIPIYDYIDASEVILKDTGKIDQEPKQGNKP